MSSGSERTIVPWVKLLVIVFFRKGLFQFIERSLSRSNGFRIFKCIIGADYFTAEVDAKRRMFFQTALAKLILPSLLPVAGLIDMFCDRLEQLSLREGLFNMIVHSGMQTFDNILLVCVR